MNSRTSSIIVALLGAASFGWIEAAAQDESDILRFSTSMPQGTARSMGFGSALGSIGGDFSSLTVNPAGIGVYRSSEFQFTPSLKLNGTSSTYQNNTIKDNNVRFNINNVGLVLTNAAKGRRYKNSNWKAVSFGFGINRIADFSRNYVYSGNNNTSSGSEVFLIDANNYPDDYDNTATLAGLGYQSYLIDYNADSLQYYPVVNWETGLKQQRSVEERGGITDINFSFGGNYKEKLFLGATVGIPSLRYKREVVYREDDISGNANNNFAYFEYTETLKSKGTGINLKLGAIYNVTPSLRIGAAFHTPTYYSITDNQTRYVVSSTENLKASLGDNSGPSTRVDAPDNEYQYSMTTPWRGVLSAAGIIGKRGFVTIDYEYVNYASARYYFEAADKLYQNEVNSNLKNIYKGVSNVRLGGELKFDMVMLRLGLGYYGNPYQNASSGSSRLDISGGLGMRFDDVVFIDLAVVHSMFENTEQPYTLNYPAPIGTIPVPQAKIKNNFNNVALTLGFKF